MFGFFRLLDEKDCVFNSAGQSFLQTDKNGTVCK